jgi:hypothetical protein
METGSLTGAPFPSSEIDQIETFAALPAESQMHPVWPENSASRLFSAISE